MVDNIHSRKRSREEAYWTAEISQELLRLRFRELQHHFDNAQTVADVHEAWGVVASTLNRKTEWGLQVNAVDCSDHFTKLRQQWEESSTIKLHVMMAECFSTRIVDTHQSIEQERTEVDTAQGMLKKSKIVTGIQQVHEVSVSSSADPVPMAQDDKAISSSQPATATSSEPSSSTARDIESFSTAALDQDRLLTVSDFIAVSRESVPSHFQETLVTDVPVEEEEEDKLYRYNEIMQALEKRSQQLERLAQSHKHLAIVTEQLMEALITRNIGFT